ncbi:MAG: sensor domain-containing diguanylate cyclase [Zetaproteobacteria bacterium]|nr:MAG: sensor domain-containing diguanylate cyclase [Zetaproteobacteria bacterium]
MEALQGIGQPILLLGGGKGARAMIETLWEEEQVCIVGVADPNPDAPGFRLAQERGIPTFSDALEALKACKPCIAVNLTGLSSISEAAVAELGAERVLGGEEARLIWLMIDKLKQAKRELERSQAEMQAILHAAVDGIIVIRSSGEIVLFNAAAEGLFGYAAEEVLGRNVCMLMPEAERKQHAEYIHRYLRTGKSHIIGREAREVTALRKNGESFPLELSVNRLDLDDGLYFVGVVRDISARKQAEEKIRQLAHYDALTGLPNRSLFFERLSQAMAQARRYGHQLGLLFIDLDGFKPINDKHGHDIGDLVLKEVARRFRQCVRESDTVARIGGDEFVVLLPELEGLEGARSVANKLLQALAEPVQAKDVSCSLGCSIGVALFPDHGRDVDQLVKQADLAMYEAKRAGKNKVRIADEDGL